ncbi:heat shock protein Hsp20 [Salinihabitans flavidus]|uniref:Heat shock protein Hsp20 n=1 Tax=Salinihabitans flavidus TaxID=569882 RepID=A0A1H8TVC4_9RHOB|nr:Hsp20/alpha crystallin family protein [Salinihabitans flavidus]SEO94949.1 heat shock protein Hsp20 [Salinihabitans flavidus]
MNIQSLAPWTHSEPAQWQRERDPFMTLQQQMNRLFDDAFRGVGGSAAARGVWPAVDVTDNGDHLRVDAEVPGLNEDDLEVTLKDGVLTLSGERQTENADADKRITERFMGRFVRQIPLGFEVDEDNVKASFDNGELTITLPKTNGDGAKRIEIGKAS